jgi:hypothetical protein
MSQVFKGIHFVCVIKFVESNECIKKYIYVIYVKAIILLITYCEEKLFTQL